MRQLVTQRVTAAINAAVADATSSGSPLTSAPHANREHLSDIRTAVRQWRVRHRHLPGCYAATTLEEYQSAAIANSTFCRISPKRNTAADDLVGERERAARIGLRSPAVTLAPPHRALLAAAEAP